MSTQGGPLLGAVFAPIEVLPMPVRLELATRLAEPGLAPPILPDGLATRPLPTDPHASRAVGHLIKAGLSPATVAMLRELRLDAIVPVLRESAGGSGAIGDGLPVRLRRIIEQHAGGVPLAEITVGGIADCPGIGPSRVVTVVGAAITAGLEMVAAGLDPASADASLDDLTTVLLHDAAGSGVIGAALADAMAQGPADVRLAAQRLLAMRPMTGSAADGRVRYLARLLGAAGDTRDRAVFEHAVLVPTTASRPAVAAAIEVGAERLRQLRYRAIDRVDLAARECPDDIRGLATSVGRRIGSAAPFGAVDDALISLGLPALPDSRSRLLLWLAGPYREVDGHPGWVGVDPAELVAETRRMIGEDDGVRLIDHLVKELATLGMATEHVENWLARQPVRSSTGSSWPPRARPPTSPSAPCTPMDRR